MKVARSPSPESYEPMRNVTSQAHLSMPLVEIKPKPQFGNSGSGVVHSPENKDDPRDTVGVKSLRLGQCDDVRSAAGDLERLATWLTEGTLGRWCAQGTGKRSELGLNQAYSGPVMACEIST